MSEGWGGSVSIRLVGRFGTEAQAFALFERLLTYGWPASGEKRAMT